MEYVLNKKKLPELRECTCLKKENFIYYFAKNFNILSRINIDTGINEVITSFYDEHFDDEYLVTNLVEYDGIIICVPYTAKHIHMVDIVQKKEIRRSSYERFMARGECYNTFIEDSICYLFPLFGNRLIKLDLKQGSIVDSVNIAQKYKNFSGEDYKAFSLSGCYRLGNKLYMCMYETAVIVEFDYKTANIQFYKIDAASLFYTFITGNEKTIYILGNEGAIYIYDVESKETRKIKELNMIKEEIVRYKYSIKKGTYIYVFKYIPSDEFIRINIVNNKIEVLSLIETYNMPNQKNNLLNYMASDENNVYFLSQRHELYILGIGTKSIKVVPLKVEIERIDDIIKYHKKAMKMNSGEIMSEGAYIWTLQNYIKNLRDIPCIEDKSNNGIIGNEIYEGVKNV